MFEVLFVYENQSVSITFENETQIDTAFHRIQEDRKHGLSHAVFIGAFGKVSVRLDFLHAFAQQKGQAK